MIRLRSGVIVAVIALLASLVTVPAYALDGIFHNPTGIDDLYSSEPTERAPRDPMAGDAVQINATTWPIESGQTVWVTWTTTGQSVYAVGSVPQLGGWSVAGAVKLSPTAYPTWTATIGKLPPNTSIEWKCVKRQETNFPDTADQWQPGGNSTFTSPASGTGGTTTGAF